MIVVFWCAELVKCGIVLLYYCYFFLVELLLKVMVLLSLFELLAFLKITFWLDMLQNVKQGTLALFLDSLSSLFRVACKDSQV
jgi:hypothetical protein